MRRVNSLFLMVLMATLSRPAMADRIDDYVRREMERQHIPGCSVAIVRNGQAGKPRSYGLANLEHNVPVTPNTVFQIQSMTKSFTAAGILMLVEEGKIGLDDPASRYLDGAPTAWKGITVRNLLTHTSGLKDYINEPTQSLRLDVTEEDVLQAAAIRPVNFEPGARYEYSNTNYLLLGMIIRKLTGQGYGPYLAERIFQPLGMGDTRIYSWSEVIPHRTAGYQWVDEQWRNGVFIAETVLGYPGGGILSTARDLQKWDLALASGRLLRDETRRLMWTPARLNDGTKSGYGLGWGVGTMNGHSFQSHNGRHSSGFASTILRLPDDRLTVIVLTNLQGADTDRLAQGVAGQYVPAVLPEEPSAKR